MLPSELQGEGTRQAQATKLFRALIFFIFLNFFHFFLFFSPLRFDAFFDLAISAQKGAKMPPFKKVPKTEALAKEQGLSSMTSFFSAKKAPGRPAKKASNAGRPADEKGPALAAAPAAAVAKPKAPKPKATRVSYSKGEGLQVMTEALGDWELELLKPKEERKSVRLFAEEHKIPFTTFQSHITPDDSKRIKLGNGVGRKPTIGPEQQAIIVDVLVRKDRGNQGVGVGGALDILEQMCPEKTRLQLDQSLRRTVRPAHAACSSGHDYQADGHHAGPAVALSQGNYWRNACGRRTAGPSFSTHTLTRRSFSP